MTSDGHLWPAGGRQSPGKTRRRGSGDPCPGSRPRKVSNLQFIIQSNPLLAASEISKGIDFLALVKSSFRYFFISVSGFAYLQIQFCWTGRRGWRAQFCCASGEDEQRRQENGFLR
jgi:hypothetical protein